MLEAFGTTHNTYLRETRGDAMNSYVNETLRILTNARVHDLIKQWRRESGHHSPRGRKQTISEHAALGVIFIQMRIDGDLRFNNMAETIVRLNDSQRESLGIRSHDVEEAFWYDRLWRAVDRLQRLVDAYPGNRRKLPSREEYKRILDARDPEESELKTARLSTLCNALLDGSVQMMPRELRRRFKGNTALDATKIPLNGRLGGPSKMNPDGAHLSCNYDGGWYVREGNHDGSSSTYKDKRDWAIEAEITTMTANTPGEAADFPLLAHGVSFHKPGKIKGEGGRLVRSLVARGYPIDHFIADRAYLPRSKAHELQGPLTNIGARLVFDYDYDERGRTTYYADVIQVAGQWYLHYMPAALIGAHDLYDEERRVAGTDEKLVHAAKELRDERLAERELYRLKPKGRHRADGSRQYMYPAPALYGGIAVDEKTGELLEPITKKTIVIPRAEKALKFGQEYPYKSPKWKAFYGLRNTIESQNAYVKDTATEDIGSPMKRRARGNTFASLAVAVALATANVRKILTFIQANLARVPVTSKNKDFAKTYYSSSELPAATAPIGTPPPDH